MDKGSPSRYFDKVVMATGPHVKDVVPEVRGSSQFSGQMLHSRAFKLYAHYVSTAAIQADNSRPEDFRGKRVVLVGLGNSSGDISDSLCNVAASVSISHNRGAVIVSSTKSSPISHHRLTSFKLPRHYKGLPSSHMVTQRRIKTQDTMQRHFPDHLDRAMKKKAQKLMHDAFGEFDPSWRLDSAPSLGVSPPIVSDTLISNLRCGNVQSVAGIDSITGPSELKLVDGSTIQADAIIFCTGYHNDYAMLDPRFDPMANPPSEWTEAPGSRGRPIPRLYQNVFSLQRPDSLAFLGCAWFATGAFCLADIASMCIAQVWAGNSTLPPPKDMESWADTQEKRVCALAQKGTPVPTTVPQLEWLAWADKTMGSGVLDRLGWGLKGWSFWLRDHAMWSLLMDGLLTSSMWRLFDEGKRKPWDGAREAILEANEEAALMKANQTKRLV